jgi:YesN/AraC family two-component response regulator
MSYKVVLIDDKPLVLRSLKETVDWSKLNCTVEGEAMDGIEAVELMNRIRPDIVVSDIKMPGMDGLELTEHIKSKFPEAKVIIITGYQEFEYAKKAVSLGVIDLVLKPIDNSLLIKVLEKAIDQLVRTREQLEYHNRLIRENVHYRDQYRSFQDKLRSRFLYNLLQRNTADGSLSSELENLQMDGGRYHITIARIRSAQKEIRLEVMGRIMETLDSLKSLYGVRLIDTEIDGDMVILFMFDRKTSVRNAKYDIKKLYDEVVRRLSVFTETRFCCVVSHMIKDANLLKWEYKQALEVLNSCYFSTRSNVLFVDNETISGNMDSISIIEDLDKFYRSIDVSGDEELREDIDMLVNRIVESSGGAEFRIKCLLSEVCITLSRHYLMWVVKKNEYQMAVNRLLDEIDGINTLEAAQKYLNSYIGMIKENLEKETSGYSSLVKDALKYIKQNFVSDISLEAASEYINANPSYLSRLLKKETGRSFVEIVTQMRIDTAKYLLLQPGSKIMDVCNQAGYNNYAYFYQVFKKVVGVTPTDYKKTGKKI